MRHDHHPMNCGHASKTLGGTEMLSLSAIQNTVMQVAEAITAALDIETEIVDNKLRIIGGTGRYVKKIGSLEEDGNLDSLFIYSSILKTGREYVCMDVRKDPTYNQKEGEFAEISCPIQVENQIIGIIGLVAFTSEQQKKMAARSETYLNFLRRMSELIASKLIESQSNSKLASMLESMPEGLLATDGDGKIFSCNFTCELLLNRKREEMVGLRIDKLFPNEDFFAPGSSSGGQARTKEIVLKEMRYFFTAVPIPGIGIMYLFQDMEEVAAKASQLAHTDSGTTFENILGQSQAIIETKRRALQVSGTDSTVMITGESGTGKELFARAIHSASPRSAGPFISINCGAIPDSLLESELFGYEKGAFTGAATIGKPGKFEIANKGTIFLDEIGDMPIHLQVKLLHVLQNKTFERVGGVVPIKTDVRIIAATNKNLEDQIEKGEFREDLYFRLNVIPLGIPPLRERGGDIDLLLLSTLERFNQLLGKHVSGFEPRAMQMLSGYDWPGNVRELENAVEYAVNMAQGGEIMVANLPPRIQKALEIKKSEQDLESTSDICSVDTWGSDESVGKTLKAQTDAIHRKAIAACLAETGESLEGKRKAAEMLGISESTLYRRIRELGL
jgi:transcriptional regulator with PAS, ATPase and Fis domain